MTGQSHSSSALSFPAYMQLVVHKPTKKVYALKCMRVANIEALKATENVLSERAILAETDCPFIVKLHATFKTRNFLFMLLEPALGGELFRALVNEGTLSEERTRFYVASIALAFEHLHSRKIAYRDLKPENLMLEKSGYIQLVDFGFSKKVSSKTYTMCGTPDYMAPEIIKGSGHSVEVDWWALGVLCFELLAGYTPFSDGADVANELVVYDNILRGTYDFPDKFPKGAQNMVAKLMDIEPERRCGWATGTIKDLKVGKGMCCAF